MAKKTKNIQYYEAIGRRKEAVARVRLYLVDKEKTANVKGTKAKQGEIYINDKLLETFYPSIFNRKKLMLPLMLTKNENRFATLIHVEGGGKTGQMEAIMNGLAKAVEQVDKAAYRVTLKASGLLTRDSRIRERRKVGKGGKSRRRKQSPKR